MIFLFSKIWATITHDHGTITVMHWIFSDQIDASIYVPIHCSYRLRYIAKFFGLKQSSEIRGLVNTLYYQNASKFAISSCP